MVKKIIPAPRVSVALEGGSGMGARSSMAMPEPWHTEDRLTLMKLIRKHPAKPGMRPTRWDELLEELNNPPPPPLPPEEVEKRKKQADSYEDALAKGKKGKALTPPDTWLPEPPQVPQRVLEEVYKQVPHIHEHKMKTGEVISLEVDELLALRTEQLFTGMTAAEGKRLSREERHELHRPGEEYNYAEIVPAVFGQMLQKLKMIHGHMQPTGGEFWDIGCGLGKPVFVAALIHNFKLCCGVDYIGKLTEGARKIQERYDGSYETLLTEKERDAREDMEISFREEDALNGNVDWFSNGTLIFCNCSCFPARLMATFQDQCNRLQHGAVVITVTKRITSDKFFLLWQERFDVSWGTTNAYVWERKIDPPRPVTPAGVLNEGQNVLLAGPKPAIDTMTAEELAGLSDEQKIEMREERAHMVGRATVTSEGDIWGKDMADVDEDPRIRAARQAQAKLDARRESELDALKRGMKYTPSKK